MKQSGDQSYKSKGKIMVTYFSKKYFLWLLLYELYSFIQHRTCLDQTKDYVLVFAAAVVLMMTTGPPVQDQQNFVRISKFFSIFLELCKNEFKNLI
jgi:hypothetical protein